MLLVIPSHTIYFFSIYYLTKGHKPDLDTWLVLFYLIAAFIQVIIHFDVTFIYFYITFYLKITLLFIICYWLVHAVWRIKRNPDDFCISLLTSLGDIFGVALLYLSFHLVYLTGNKTVDGHLFNKPYNTYTTASINITNSFTSY